MKKIKKGSFLFFAFLVSITLLFSCSRVPSEDMLEHLFLNPPDEAKPWVYWFWMNGNISEEGITADLEAMHRIGIGGALIMNVGLRTPHGPHDFNSPSWRALYRHAAAECVRLGMKLTLHPLDGWATSGGQWISPEQSIKMLVWSSLDVEGSTNLPIQLEQPFTLEDFYEDVAILAFPAPGDDLLRPDRITVNGKSNNVMFDGNLRTGVGGDVDVLAEFDEPVELSTVVFPRETSWPYHLQRFARTPTTIEVSSDGMVFETVYEFDYNLAIDNGDQFSLTVSFPSREVMAVRIRLQNQRPDVEITEIELRSLPRVNLWEVKSSLARERNHGGETFIIDAAPFPDVIEGIDPSQIIDLSGRVAGDGTLDWSVPPGRWRIVRAGMTSTGKHVAPQTHAGAGLEADKMNREAVRHHWNSFGKGMVEEMNIASGNPIWSVHTDSWESQVHTWGAGFQEEFEKRRGYSMTPWLPVLTLGAIVGSAEESERFLWDYRRTAADLIAENFYGEMRRLANESGLLFQSEAAGRQMFMYDPLNYAARTDFYVGEFWMPGEVRVDCKIAASIANTYDRPFAAAEAWTSGNGSLNDAPFDWKPLGDHAFTVGINRVIIHRYAMQPFNNVEPGITFGPYGINFERTQTFWENGGKAWVEYLTRCQALLQTGIFVADVIHYIGHDAPNYLGHRDQLWNPVPPGYDFDGCNLEILQRLQVDSDGTLTLPSGMRYRVLLLSKREHMTLEAIREVERLVRAGATVVGPRPQRTPGLHNHLRNDAELAAIAHRVWGDVGGQSVTENRYGKGRVIYGPPLESVLEAMVPPDFDYTAPENAIVRYIHRQTDEGHFYFVANGNKEMAFDAVLRFRVTGKRPELWDPSTGAIRKLDVWREDGGVTEIPVQFDPAGSWFVVFREEADPPDMVDFGLERNTDGRRSHPAGAVSSDQLDLDGPWTVSFPPNKQAPAKIELPELICWTRHDESGVKYFSGTARYQKTFYLNTTQLEDFENAAVLDLGKVKEIAEVKLNGRSLGVLWKPPFRVNLSDALRVGENTLQIDITNLWPNRLIGDEKLHPDPSLDHLYLGGIWGHGPQRTIPHWVREGGDSPVGRTTWILVKFYEADSPLLPSGLLGPVQIQWTRNK